MRETQLVIESEGLKLQGDLQRPESAPYPLVILCHGFLSHKDGSKYRQLARVLAEGGIATIRFDFRGCGQSEGSLGESTVSGRWKDLQQVIDQSGSLDGFNGSLGLLGSSLGGYVVLLEASRNPVVRCVVVWSTPSDLSGLAVRLSAAAPVPMSRKFHEDLNGVELLSRLAEVQNVLILHGEQDHLVVPEHGSKIFSAVKEPKRLEIMAGGDHRFSQARVRQQAVDLSLEWFRRFL
jgi:fermentation-respiration switch protein FrsA (DUF1100 family)